MNITKFLCGLTAMSAMLLMASCGSAPRFPFMHYQSVRLENPKPQEEIRSAEISVIYNITTEGDVSVEVCNLTDDIMIIDQTMSFFVNSAGQSLSYYDPTVRTTTTSDISSSSSGAGVNLGAIGSALGIGGPIGSILGGINVGGSSSSGQTTSNATYVVDQPRVSIGPRGRIKMSKVFKCGPISAIDIDNKVKFSGSYVTQERLNGLVANNFNVDVPLPNKKFSVCISYSSDGGNSFKKLTSNMFQNCEAYIPVPSMPQANEALRNFLRNKPDAVNEPWWSLEMKINTNGCYYEGGASFLIHRNRLFCGKIIDFQ